MPKFAPRSVRDSPRVSGPFPGSFCELTTGASNEKARDAAVPTTELTVSESWFGDVGTNATGIGCGTRTEVLEVHDADHT